MPTLSASKKATISEALKRNGVIPSDEAIAGVVDILKKDGRVSPTTAAKRYAEANGEVHEQRQSASRSQQSADAAGETLNAKIANARDAVRRNMKAQIIIGGVGDALEEISAGDFDDLEMEALSALDDFTSRLEASHNLLIEAEKNPVPLSLPAAIDVEATA
jgi:hypothetical protein